MSPLGLLKIFLCLLVATEYALVLQANPGIFGALSMVNTKSDYCSTMKLERLPLTLPTTPAPSGNSQGPWYSRVLLNSGWPLSGECLPSLPSPMWPLAEYGGR